MTGPVVGEGAVERWRRSLAAWEIPPEILAVAPESPWGFPPALFARQHETGPTPSATRALEALPVGGSVLDVGVGAGAASLALVPPAGRVVGVDESTAMLDAFSRAASGAGVDHEVVSGRWPDVSDGVAVADVVVCHHVAYNVADLEAFVSALTRHARLRVVLEMTAVHPQVAVAGLWRHFWGLERPTGPAADDALAVLRTLGLDVTAEQWDRPGRHAGVARRDIVAFTRRRLCLSADRDPEVDAALGTDEPIPRAVVTMWWPGSAPGA